MQDAIFSSSAQTVNADIPSKVTCFLEYFAVFTTCLCLRQVLWFLKYIENSFMQLSNLKKYATIKIAQWYFMDHLNNSPNPFFVIMKKTTKFCINFCQKFTRKTTSIKCIFNHKHLQHSSRLCVVMIDESMYLCI